MILSTPATRARKILPVCCTKLIWLIRLANLDYGGVGCSRQSAMDMETEANGEMALLPARLHPGQGGEYLVLSEGCVPIAAGPRLGPSSGCRDVPREEDKTADKLPLPQAASSSVAPTRAARQVDPHFQSTETNVPRSQTYQTARERLDLRGNVAPCQPPHDAPQDW